MCCIWEWKPHTSERPGFETLQDCVCDDSLLNVVMSPVGHKEQQGDDGSDGGS
jgi:hypothetical protein